MQIASLNVTNFIGARAVQVQCRSRVQLFAGRNGAGKTSLRDAIALALTGELSRVSLKKDAPALIADGADLAVAELTDADGDAYKVTINRSGKINNSRERFTPDPMLPFVLDAQRLAKLEPVERRAFLFGLMGLRTDGAAIVERLQKRGVGKVRIDRIQPLLRSGFDAACKEAKAKATEAKGAWRAVTGETYGSEKAKTWKAAVPPFDAKVSPTLATELQHCDVAIGKWQEQVGSLRAEEQRRQTQRAKLPALQEHAGRIPRIEAKLATDQQQLTDWDADLAKTAAAAGAAPRVGLVHDLARAMTDMMMEIPAIPDGSPLGPLFDAAQDVLDRYTAEHGAVFAEGGGDDAARARLPSVQRSRDLMASAVGNDKRDLAAAQQAKAEADAITTELAEVFDVAALAEANAQIEALKLQRAAIVTKQDAQKSVKAQVDAAEGKTKQAAQHAVDVAAWEQMGDALAPDGIPGEILVEALGPFNERLAQSAADTEWPTVVIAADMAITAAGRAYRLLSESERWRVDAVLSEAVAHLSGARLLVLDGFDLLDGPGRSQMLGWLDVLADAGEIDTALIFATLKALPAELPALIEAHWIENGVVGQLKAAA